ncbi:MAG TPA: glycosyltransferase [Geodermatophilus sp.]|nr:glycosyltransferase [Geodermatophilus sp.]
MRVLEASVGTVLRIVVLGYAVAILALIWMARELTIASLTRDPLFATYSIAVLCYVLGRFALSLFYRPSRDVGHRPSVSVIIPAFNEEEGILGTIQSIVRSDYPADRLEVVVVNDGSTDGTWAQILAAKARWPQVRAVDLGANYGKRAAMAEGIRRSRGDVLAFVDSDSYLRADALAHLVAPFTDPRVGGVVGHAEVKNRHATWLTKMQQVRYYAAFRIIKGTESLLSGTVICASGCCAAYRRDVLTPFLHEWEFQTFLGRPATFGDDRALTNRVLQTHRVVYQSTARAETVAPDTLRRFLRQQLRWKKSWLRESLYVVRYFWRKNPLAALFTYASIGFPLFAPVVVLHALWSGLSGGTGTFWFYAVGSYAMAVLYSLYYAFVRRDGLWFHGMTFVGLYMTTLVFQTYWGMFTMRDTRWGTRDSTVEHRPVDQQRVTDLAPGAQPILGLPASRRDLVEADA